MKLGEVKMKLAQCDPTGLEAHVLNLQLFLFGKEYRPGWWKKRYSGIGGMGNSVPQENKKVLFRS